MWWNWNPLNPPINQVSSGDEGENYESPEEDDPNALVSPRRPRQSPSASPRALLRPYPPPVEEVLQEVGQQLRNLPNRQQRADNRNAVRRAAEAAEAAAARAAGPGGEEVEEGNNRDGTMPNDPPPPVVEYDTANTRDGDKAQELARSIKVEFEPNDVKFWFAQLEGELLMASVGSQWLKKTVLQRNLPNKQKEDLKSYLTLTQTEAGNTIYRDIKQELIRLYAPKPCDSYRKALTRTMVGLPSQLGCQIVDDICKKPNKLRGCCCGAAAEALWSMQLPVHVRSHVSNMDFNADTYKSVFEAADKCYLSAKQISVAAVAMATPSLDETLPAFSAQNQPHEVAAVRTGGSGKGKKNNKNQNQNSQNQSQDQNNKGSGNGKKNNKRPWLRGSKSDQNPPDTVCDRHYVHGDRAFYCTAPLTCPWVSKVTAPSSSK